MKPKTLIPQIPAQGEERVISNCFISHIIANWISSYTLFPFQLIKGKYPMLMSQNA